MSKKNRRTAVSVDVASATSRNEFNPDYTHVKRDLTRIGVLAGSFIAILVVLSFVLPLIIK